MSNALENAIHACNKQPDGEKRAIRVQGHKAGTQFFFEIANTFTGKVQFDAGTGLPVSKEKGHGVGSKSIAFFAQKYGAALEYSQNENWFHLRLLLRAAY